MSNFECESPSCVSDLYSRCQLCSKCYCVACIESHHCPTAPISSSSEVISGGLGSSISFFGISANVSASASATAGPIEAPIVQQSRAAFERKRKAASEELLAQEAVKSARYSTKDLVVPAKMYPLIIMAASLNRSWLWNHFKKINIKVGSNEVIIWGDTHASCNICYERALLDEKVKWAVPYTTTHSPGHLERHLKYMHNEILVEKRKVLAANQVQGKSITSYFPKHPDFEEKYLRWAVHTYQPINTIEGDKFRDMCRSLSVDAPIISKVKVVSRLLQVEQNVKYLFRKALEGQYVAITLDHWTSNANVGYVAQTAHYIDEQWTMKSLTLACSLHGGGTSGDNSKLVSVINFHY